MKIYEPNNMYVYINYSKYMYIYTKCMEYIIGTFKHVSRQYNTHMQHCWS